MLPSDLSLFLRDLAGRRWRYGETDCLMTLSDWVKRRHGVDPAAAWRGTYDSEAGAIAALHLGGGIIAMIDGALAAHGFSRSSAPASPGNICVVRVPTVLRGRFCRASCGAIALSEAMSAALTTTGSVVAAAMPRLALWNT